MQRHGFKCKNFISKQSIQQILSTLCISLEKNHTNLKQYITPSLAIYIHIYTMPVIGLIQSPNVASKGINLKTVVKRKQNMLYSLLEMFLVMGARRNLPKSHVYC